MNLRWSASLKCRYIILQIVVIVKNIFSFFFIFWVTVVTIQASLKHSAAWGAKMWFGSSRILLRSKNFKWVREGYCLQGICEQYQRFSYAAKDSKLWRRTSGGRLLCADRSTEQTVGWIAESFCYYKTRTLSPNRGFGCTSRGKGSLFCTANLYTVLRAV